MIDEKIKLIENSKLLFHEQCEPERLQKIQKNIDLDGFLINPVLVTKLEENKYIILDGAHRAKALITLGFKYVPVQLFDEKDIVVESWMHLIENGISLLDKVFENKNLIVNTPIEDSRLKLITTIITKDDEYSIFSKNEHYYDEWINLIDYYNKESIIRLQNNNVTLQENDVLMKFPSVALKEIKNIISQNKLLPCGVTRIHLENRLLNLKVPTRFLNDNNNLEWIEFINMKKKNLRYYKKPVYIVEA
ncbi:ParB N-terminal domain-containing protein [Bacillus thuringiensis]|uniref:ParB N-terminal domain-containing protein n=1 Tax=Bacillus thuringiensis TaxID=1428 RepID=UPI0015CF802E|nr:ParB N-terminal domain-containing protein [Bacillus thuringiensis]MED3053030.1 ParB N-terminal domain-containing protein [Bacillus thuringiensis]